MKWEMEIDEIEAVLAKIWDLHDKLSDAIHSISRAHFLNSIKNPTRRSDGVYFHRKKKSADDDSEKKDGRGFVFVKDFRVDEDEPAVQEAKSLYAIRTALENLEDQFEFFHCVQTQQKAERDAAVARLEQSRIILAMRLAEHQGRKYKVIEEAQALVGDVRDTSRLVTPEHLYSSAPYPPDDNFVPEKQKRSNPAINFLFSSVAFVSKSLKLGQTVGVLGNAALLAVSMIAFVQLSQIGSKDSGIQYSGSFGRESRKDSPCSLDVMLARG